MTNQEEYERIQLLNNHHHKFSPISIEREPAWKLDIRTGRYLMQPSPTKIYECDCGFRTNIPPEEFEVKLGKYFK